MTRGGGGYVLVPRDDTPDIALRQRQRGPLTARDALRPVFRHRSASVACFAALSTSIALAVWFWPTQYTAEMNILVKATGHDSSHVSDADVRAEVELLKSRDLLEQVALAAGFGVHTDHSPGTSVGPLAVARAAHRLAGALSVTPVPGAPLIHVTYTARDPVSARNVLAELSRRYLSKHQTLTQPAGSNRFFTDENERLQHELHDAEQQLVAFGRTNGVVEAARETTATLDRLAQLEASHQDLQAQAADATRRLQALTRELAATPARQTTVQRTEDNAALMHDLQARILELELKRTELVRKYTDTYPLVADVNQQLQEARSALASAERAPLRTETTDQNPTHQWLSGELSRVGAERAALQARAAAVEHSIEQYRARARQLDDASATERDLKRQVASAQERYALSQRKGEEARIADALDRTNAANVAVAEEATVPAVPVSHAGLAGGGILAAAGLSLVLAFVLEWLNPCFRSREEIWAVLDVPVLAALPPAE